jgi:hypothetical protein
MGGLMFLDDTPISALRTPCISECQSTIYWSYDSGEPMTRHYPGSPDFFTPEAGCSEDHLDILNGYGWEELYAGELYRQLAQWEIILDGARRSKHSSCTYLGVRPRSFTNPRGYA